MSVQLSSPSAPEDASKLARLLEISLELNSTADMETLLRVIMDAATELTGSEAASVLLLDPHTRDLYFAAASGGSNPDLIGMTVPTDSSIAGTILKTNEPIIAHNVAQDPRHDKRVAVAIDFETHSLLGVPLLAEGDQVGVLESINKLEGGFTADDTEVLTTLANFAAITIRKAALISQLQDANELLSELDRLKNAFISIASHELRTPLGIILGYANLLKDQVRAEELDYVLKAAAQLRTLMEGMFNLQHVDTGQAKLDLTRFCLVQLVKEVVGNRDYQAEARGQVVTLHMPDEVCTVMGDQESLRLVLSNLLSNAFQFTPIRGQIDISVKKQSTEVWVSVQDNGIGISKAHQKRLFTRFFQAEDHLTRRHGGLGIGLAVAKELLELQNGRVWVKSQEGEGSTFTFALPLAPA